MKISKLITILGENNAKFDDVECAGIFIDSRKVCENSIFICINGARVDGHDYYEQAIDRGAKLIICQRDLGLENQIIVKEPFIAYTELCSYYFGNPASKMKLVGITGTSGKTTTSYMVKSLLEQAGHKVGLIGTIQNIIGDEKLPSHNTTPEAYELHSLFELMLKAGCDYVVMEVSSQALDQQRVHGLHFETAVFTNLSQDHLDYHITMENYLNAKLKLFEMCDNAVINLDDDAASKVIDKAKSSGCKVYTFAAKRDDADFIAKDTRFAADSVGYEFVTNSKIGRVKVMVPGAFMVYNSMAAGVVGISTGIDFDSVVKYLQNVKGVKGIVEVVPCDRDYTLIIDFAHTPDELKNVITMLSQFKNGRLVVLFGCGGDRDRTKRPLMAEAVTSLADFTIVTSDNPRSEEPGEIIKDILKGVKCGKDKYIVIEDRKEAIKYAVKNAKTDDIVLFAGKGYETYQILKNGTIHFDEREVIAQALSE